MTFTSERLKTDLQLTEETQRGRKEDKISSLWGDRGVGGRKVLEFHQFHAFLTLPCCTFTQALVEGWDTHSH